MRGLAVTAHRCCTIIKYFTLPTTHNQKPDPPSFCFDALERAEDEEMPLVACEGQKRGQHLLFSGILYHDEEASRATTVGARED